MTDGFEAFSRAVDANFKRMSKGELYTTSAKQLTDHYLLSFPDGTDPIFRVNTEHNCSCCKSFIKGVGNVVAIEDGKVTTVWDCEGLPHPYDVVAKSMADEVRRARIKGVFRTKERRYSVETNKEFFEHDNRTITWRHFHAVIADRHYSPTPGKVKGEIETAFGVFRRGLTELTETALTTMQDLINDNAIYRGQEHKASLDAFARLHRGFPRGGTPVEQDVYAWSNVKERGAMFRNSVIGNLAVDLSEGKDVEQAVLAFERMVAPTNYKRPTAVVTQRMVDGAVDTLREMGLESAIARRHAKLSDVSVTSVLWVDNAVKGEMRDGIAALLANDVKPATPDLSKAEDIGFDDFVRTVMPQARTMDLLLENRHMSNMMSLTTAVDPDSGRLFKWDNHVAWSYDGDAADSIKARVKRAGGNVDAALRVSLAWFNTDDLDIHARGPEGRHIYFGDKHGILDVDMNVHSPVRDAVENLQWVRSKLVDGTYKVWVNNYTRRESVDVGFTLEVEHAGGVTHYSYERAIQSKGNVPCLEIVVKGGVVERVDHNPVLKAGSSSQEKWGLRTETLVPIDTIMLSPNHWDGQAIGNKHLFLALRGCLNPDPVRGIYNEYLRPDLEPHRKVFELVGARSKAPYSDQQISGVGFSSTRGDSCKVVVRGDKINKTYNVTF